MKLLITDIENFDIPHGDDYKLIKANGDIRNCIGCFGCWVKTPGKCVINDGFDRTGIDLGKCTELILVSRCCYGSTSPAVKMIQDRAISYIHPDFVIRNGEMHHKRRYDNVITVSAYFYGDDITEAEKETAGNLIQSIVDNYDGKLGNVAFYKSAEELKAEVTL